MTLSSRLVGATGHSRSRSAVIPGWDAVSDPGYRGKSARAPLRRLAGHVVPDELRVLVRCGLVDGQGQQRHDDHLRLVALERAAVGADVLPPGGDRPEVRVVDVAAEIGGHETGPGLEHRD